MGTRMTSLGQLPRVEQFHEQADRAARVTVACLDHANVSAAVVTEPQTRSKAGLSEPGPLTDGFEFDGAHLPDPHRIVLHDGLLDRAIGHGASSGGAVLGVLPGLPVGSGGVGDPNFLCSGFSLLRGFDLLPGPVNASGFCGVHLHSPVSGGASLRCSPYEELCSYPQAQSHSVRRKFDTRMTADVFEGRDV